MKFRKLGSGVMASIMAVSTCIVMPVTAQAAGATLISSHTLGAWGNLEVDLTSQGIPAEGATVTVTVDNAFSGAWANIEIFNVILTNWDEPEFVVRSATGTEEAGFSQTFSIADDLGGASKFTIQNCHNECTYTVTISDVVADNREEYTAQAYDGSPITMTKQFPDWCETGTAQGTYELTIPGVTYGETTVAQLKEACKKINACPLTFVETSLEGLSADDFSCCVFYNLGENADIWGGAGSSVDFGQTAYLSVDSISDANNDQVIGVIGIQINIKDNNNLPEAVDALENGATFQINPAAAPEPTAYQLTAAESELYTVEFANGITGAVAGTEIIATVTAADGYLVKGIEATGVTLDEVISGENSVETVTFIMPEADVEVSATVEKEPAEPAAPVAPVITAFAADSKVTLTWDAVDGATNYMLYSYTDGEYAPIGRTTGTVYTVRDLTNGTEYGFLVRAYANGKWSSFTAKDVVYATPAAPAASPKPTVYPNDSKVTLTWDAIDGATNYMLYSYTDGEYAPIGRTTGTVYTVRDLTNGTEYGFLVRALVNGKWTAFTAKDVVYATPANTTPKPKTFSGDSKVTLTWDAIDGATNYMLYSYADDVYTPIGRTTGTVYTVRGLTNDTEYGFLLRALVNGKWSAFTVNDVVYETPKA